MPTPLPQPPDVRHGDREGREPEGERGQQLAGRDLAPRRRREEQRLERAALALAADRVARHEQREQGADGGRDLQRQADRFALLEEVEIGVRGDEVADHAQQQAEREAHDERAPARPEVAQLPLPARSPRCAAARPTPVSARSRRRHLSSPRRSPGRHRSGGRRRPRRSAARHAASSSARMGSSGLGPPLLWPCAASSTRSQPDSPSAASTCPTPGARASTASARSSLLGRHLDAHAPRRRRPAHDLRDGAVCDHAAAVQDQHVRAVLLDLVEQMGAQQHGGPALPRDRADIAQHLPLPRGVEAERRLVQEDGDRVVDERPRDAEPLPHPAAVGRDRRPRRARAAPARRAASGPPRAHRPASARRGGRGRSGTAPPSGRRDSPRSRAAPRSASGSRPAACAGCPPRRSSRGSARGSSSACARLSSCPRRWGRGCRGPRRPPRRP